MDPVYVGFLSIVPPIIAIGLALITKEVISSLLLGILSGGLIYSLQVNTGFFNVFTGTFESSFGTMAQAVGEPGRFNIILFLGLLGALVCVVTMAGGSRAYGNWAGGKMKSRRGAQLSTAALGAIIFIDDYFNCLTVGTVMKPVTDRQKISRAKLAYLIDATAAPICIIAPVSSWAAAVGASLVGTQGNIFESELSAFVATIPFNLYALLSIVMVVALSVAKLDFGPMAKAEEKAVRGDLGAVDAEANEEVPVSEKGKVIDLILPIGALIVFSIFAMLKSGGFFDGGVSIAAAFGDCDSSGSLVLGGFAALVVAFLLFIPRKLLSFRDFMGAVGTGIKSMVPAYIILTLAWTIGSMCGDMLQAGEFVGNAIQASNFPMALVPVIIFLVAAGLSFATGTAWGTFGILIPIVVFICQAAPEYMVVALAATLAGSVFGDHCSPISDTTILSSTGAGCDHLEHVSTQLPYALTVAAVCAVGYVIAGFTRNPYITLGVSVVLLLGVLLVLHAIHGKRYRQRMEQAQVESAAQE